MALPTIRVNSGTGSDTAASGAGPGDGVTTGTTLSGASASTSGTGLVVTLNGSPDLTNVDTTGLHAIYLADSTAGNRNFGKITAKANSGTPTAQVTVSNAFGLSLSGKSWAIGGVRATVGGTNSRKLFDNNAAAGDAMPGWAVEMASGHAESSSTSLDFRRSGDATSGPIVLRGVAGAATPPVLTCTGSGLSGAFILRGGNVWLRDLEIRGTGGSSITAAIHYNGNTFVVCSGLKIATDNTFDRGIYLTATCHGAQIVMCEIASTAGATGHGIATDADAGNVGGITIRGNYIHNNTNRGISFDTKNYMGIIVTDNLLHANGKEGIYYDNSRTDGLGSSVFERNDFNGNGTAGTYSGINVASSTDGTAATSIVNNYFRSNTGWGVHFSSASVSAATLKGWGTQIRNNGFRTNTSGEVAANGVAVTDTDVVQGSVSAADPDNASYGTSGNFAKGTASTLYEAGWPTSNIGKSSTRSYVTIGAAQPHVSAGGGGGSIAGNSMNGGFL